MLLKNEFRKMHMRVHVESPGDVNTGNANLASAFAAYNQALTNFRTHYEELASCWDPGQSDSKKLQASVEANLGLGKEGNAEAPLVKTGKAIESLQKAISQSMSALQTLIDNNGGGA